MSLKKTVFITGTDTGIGKTFVTCNIIRSLLLRNVKVLGCKPIETGVNKEEESDYYLIWNAMNRCVPLEYTNVYKFILPASIHLAAEYENKEIDITKIKNHLLKLYMEAEILIIEGAGGVLVPIKKDLYLIDIIKSVDLNLEVIIIGREGLGTLNHTLLTFHYLKSRNFNIKTIILNKTTKEPTSSLIVSSNISTLQDITGLKIFGPIKYGGESRVFEEIVNFLLRG